MMADDLLGSPVLRRASDETSEIVISSRVRLARNVKGALFPGSACPEARAKLWKRIARVLEHEQHMRPAMCLEMSAMAPVDKDVLKERQLISRELAEKNAGSGVVISEDERIAVMVNEEDHIRLQAIGPGLSLADLWKVVDAVDTELEREIPYAFHPALGYLTACPSNLGTGLRASVMMRLSGLRMMNEIDPVIRGLERMGLAVRGVQGEGSEAVGDLFQVSNQGTLGQTESAVIAHLSALVTELVRHERHARLRLFEQRRIYLLDQVGRAYGLLLHAHVLTSREAADMLSALRLGMEFNLVDNLTEERINPIMLLIQPGHLQRMMRRMADSGERDIARARLVRERLKDIRLAGTVRRPRVARRREQARETI
ncbi:MAG: protein arginine kinase [Verrucomicrobiota bacterium]|nr:protein arginine kinase [Verrucomicrobiota bacterium]